MKNDAFDNEINFHSQHIKALDGLRGYAAILVSFYHAILHMDESSIYRVLYPPIDNVASDDLKLKLVLIFFNGSTAVLLFYVLSGSVLCQSLLRDKLNLKSICLFLMRRVFRLFPALLFCMLGLWLLSLVLRRLGVVFPHVSFEAAVLNAFLFNTNVHGPSTSIQIEALATPFILLFAFAYRKLSISTAVVFLQFRSLQYKDRNFCFNFRICMRVYLCFFLAC